MKNVTAKLTGTRRVAISGSRSNIASDHRYDDNTIRMTVRVTSGPVAWLDRIIVVDMGITALVEALTSEVAVNLQKELSERLDQQASPMTDSLHPEGL